MWEQQSVLGGSTTEPVHAQHDKTENVAQSKHTSKGVFIPCALDGGCHVTSRLRLLQLFPEWQANHTNLPCAACWQTVCYCSRDEIRESKKARVPVVPFPVLNLSTGFMASLVLLSL